MQLVPRYLVKNRVNIILSQHGFITEYRPVYQRTINIYKGIDNPLQFRLINADQKPVNISSYTPVFVAYDSKDRLLVEREATILEDEDSNIGMFSVTISDADIRNTPAQYLTYAVYLVDNQTGQKIVSYSNSHFEAPGIIALKDGVMPKMTPAKEDSNFFNFKIEDVDYWATNSIETGPAVNSYDSIQTAAVYATGYTGKIIVQVSLDPQISIPVHWANVSETQVTDLQTVLPITFAGIYNFVRVVFDQDPTNKVTKVLFKI